MMKQPLNAKQFSVLFLLGLAGLFFCFAAFNYVVDPLQNYRETTWFQPLYSKEKRYQYPGFAKNKTYDTVVIGTSMSENYLASDVDSIFHGQTLNLAMSGASAKEEYLLASLAINTRQVKRVIWGMYYTAFTFDHNKVSGSRMGSFPDYLYDTDLINDYPYLLSMDTVNLSIKTIKDHQVPDFETFYSWYTDYKYGLSVMRQKWNSRSPNTYTRKNTEKEKINIEENIDKYIVELVRKHPEIDFYFVHPPQSILYHVNVYDQDPEVFLNSMYLKKYLFEQLEKYPQVKIFDFQSESSITHNYSLYKDLAHYNVSINKFILEQLKTSQYLVTKDNLDYYVSEPLRQLQEIDPDTYTF
ncbi:hypothetical protein KC571_03660 [candidate division WWE3 bacterium]|uniref:Uncharacterized protein n=1 Tax=candidate division WWE3 bacterium TaxID=2053526 RepID=A0A955RQI6_UNCKA|nr:hypothetical protein [candidate division WWE3 bacterium]